MFDILNTTIVNINSNKANTYVFNIQVLDDIKLISNTGQMLKVAIPVHV